MSYPDTYLINVRGRLGDYPCGDIETAALLLLDGYDPLAAARALRDEDPCRVNAIDVVLAAQQWIAQGRHERRETVS